MGFDSNAYKAEFRKQNYDQVGILIPKGRKDDLKALAKQEGLSISQVVVEAIRSRYGLDLSK